MTLVNVRALLYSCSLGAAALAGPFPAAAQLDFLFKNEKTIPSPEEKQIQDAVAGNLFAQAQAYYNQGARKKALSLYRQIVKKYPQSAPAPEAQFRVGEIYRSLGEPVKAFRAYESLVQEYPQSARYAAAVKHEYDLAVVSMEEKSSSFLFIPRQTSRDRVVKMFESIIASAPQSEFAPLSQYRIGRIREEEQNRAMAIDAYQKVVDNYPQSEVAPDAQLRVAKIMEYLGDRYRDRDPARLAARREAYEDFLTNYPDHEASDQARSVIGSISKQQAQKSLKIGLYYETQGNLKAAAIYYQDALRVDDQVIKNQAQRMIDGVKKKDPEAVRLAEIESRSGSAGGSDAAGEENGEDADEAASLKEALREAQNREAADGGGEKGGRGFKIPFLGSTSRKDS